MSDNEQHLRAERAAALLGLVIGQVASLLNQIKNDKLTNDDIYKNLLDISNSASLSMHGLYFSVSK